MATILRSAQMNAILWYVKYAHAFCFAIISRYVGVYMIEVHCSVPGKREFVVIHGVGSDLRLLISDFRRLLESPVLRRFYGPASTLYAECRKARIPRDAASLK